MDSIKLKSILSPDVISVTPETPLSEALSILSEKKISCVLVVENNKPVGILTERDVVTIASGTKNITKMKLTEVMSSPVITVASGLDLLNGYAVLREGKIRHLIVTNEQGTIEGVVSLTDIIDELGAILTDNRSVFEIMTRNIVTSKPDDTIHEISRKMTENSISCIIIEDDSKPFGIITERDIARVFLSRVDVSAERVNNWMSSPIHMINSNMSMPEALGLMSQKKHRRLIVHDNNKKTIGIVTQSDIVKGMLESKYLRGLRESLKKQKFALHESEERYQKLFTNMLNGFALHEIVLNEDDKPIDYIFLEVNDIFESMTGLKRSEIIGKKVTEVLFGIISDSAYLKNVYRKVALTGEGTRFEQKSEALSKWFSVNVYRPQENQLAVIFVDITERKKAEEALLNKTQLLQLLQEIAVTSNEASSVEEAIQVCLDKVCNFMGWPVGHSYMLDSRGKLNPSTIWHIENEERLDTFRNVTEVTSFDIGIGLPGRVLATGKPAWIKDVTKDPNFPRAKLAKEINVKAGIAFPMLEGGVAFPVLEGKEVTGVLEFFSEKAIEPDGFILEALSKLAVQLGRVTERKRAEEALQNKTQLLQLLQDVTIIANETSTAEDAIQACLDKVCDSMGWPVGHSYIVDSRGILVPSKIWHIKNTERFDAFREITEVTPFDPGVGLPGRVLATGKPAWIKDVTKDPNFPRAKFSKEINVKAGFAIPILEGKEVTGVLEFFSDEVVEADESILEVFSNLAFQLGRLTERKREEEKLKKSEERSRKYFKLGLIGMAMTSLEKGWIDFNDVLCDMFGYSRVEFSKLTWTELTYPEDLEPDLAQFNRVLKKEIDGYSMEKRFIHKDGSIFHAEISAKALRKPDGSVDYFVALVQDITDRKKVELKLKDSEKRSRVWLECSPVCTKIVDLDFNLQYMSAAGVKGLKIDDVSQLYGKPYPFDFYPESFRNLMIKNLEKAKETGEIITQEAPVVDVEGNKLWFHSTLVPVNDDEGLTEYIIVVSVDTTARREAEKDLRKLTNAIEHSVESVVITDFEGTIEYVNPAFEKITEYSKSEVLGENQRIVKSGLYDRAFYKSMWDTIKSGEIWQGELVNKKKSGEKYTERMSISPVFDNEGNIGNFVAIKEDVTREKKLQQQLFQSEKLSSIGTFISGVAHELNNPLTAVLGFSEVLMDDKNLSNDVRKNLDRIATQSERAAKIVKNLLKFSRENKEGKLAVNINDILESTLILEEYHFKTGNVEVIKDFAENLPSVFVDGNQIQQVFMNVLQNAFHSMTEANIKGEIKIKTVSKDNEIKIIIENDGPPIPEDMLEKIFDAFFTTKKVGKGTGLGLYVSFGILKEHGGSIRVENIKDSGVRFIICLPVSDKITTGTKEEKVKKILPENIRILVVDDEEVIRDWLKKLLTKRASRVFLAENGKKAIEILKGEEVDVILSDARMPVCSGLEFGEWLKNNKPAYLKKFILLTGAIDQQISDFCSQNRCDYLQKPLQGNVIIEKIYETYKR